MYAGSLAFTVYAVARYYGVEKAPGWIAQTDGRAWYATDVDDAGPAAGRIQRGDRLLAINGDERYAVEGMVVWSFVEGGKTYRVDLERHGERVSFELPLPVVSGQRLTPILAKDPRDRYGSATEVAKELVPALGRCAGFEARRGVSIPDSPALR